MARTNPFIVTPAAAGDPQRPSYTRIAKFVRELGKQIRPLCSLRCVSRATGRARVGGCGSCSMREQSTASASPPWSRCSPPSATASAWIASRCEARRRSARSGGCTSWCTTSRSSRPADSKREGAERACAAPRRPADSLQGQARVSECLDRQLSDNHEGGTMKVDNHRAREISKRRKRVLHSLVRAL